MWERSREGDVDLLAEGSLPLCRFGEGVLGERVADRLRVCLVITGESGVWFMVHGRVIRNLRTYEEKAVAE